jgi:hypothetical protein
MRYIYTHTRTEGDGLGRAMDVQEHHRRLPLGLLVAGDEGVQVAEHPHEVGLALLHLLPHGDAYYQGQGLLVGATGGALLLFAAVADARQGRRPPASAAAAAPRPGAPDARVRSLAGGRSAEEHDGRRWIDTTARPSS